MAVIAGRWISTRLSVKKSELRAIRKLTAVTLAGAGAFILFAFLYGHEAYTAAVNGDVDW